MGTVASTQSTSSQAVAAANDATHFAGTTEEHQEEQPHHQQSHDLQQGEGSPPRPTPSISSDEKCGITIDRLTSLTSPSFGLSSEPLHQALSHLDAATTIQALASISSPSYQQLRHAAASLPPPSQLLPLPTASSPPTQSTPTEAAGLLDSQPEDDGYKWRKYGRKSVKGNQFPRSYYKCTYPGCTVKKQVETTIKNGAQTLHTTYNGQHNHDAPQVTRLNAEDQTTFKNSVMSEFLGAATALAADTIATMATSCPPSSATETPVHASTTTTTTATASSIQGVTGTQSGPTPRLVIETKSDVDHLDDGYHWRKYGQKNVKGSPYPRSYYKCTEKDCPVKKQVEQNGVHVINTYEGTHNHLAPGLDGSSRKRRRQKQKRDESFATEDGEDVEQERPQTAPRKRRRPRSSGGQVYDSQTLQQRLSTLSVSSSILSLISASKSPSLAPSTSPTLYSTSSSSSVSSNLLPPIPIDSISQLLSERHNESTDDEEDPDDRDTDGSACKREQTSSEPSEPQTAAPTPSYPHNFPGLFSQHSVMNGQLSAREESSTTTDRKDYETSIPLTRIMSPTSSAPLTPIFSATTPNINSPSLQSLLSGSLGVLSLSPMFDGNPYFSLPQLLTPTQPLSPSSSTNHNLTRTAEEGLATKGEGDDVVELQDDQHYSPANVPSISAPPPSSSSRSPDSPAASSTSFPPPSVLGSLITPAATESMQLPDTVPTLFSHVRSPSTIPASLFACDTASAVAMLLINEDLTQLD